MVGTPGHRSLLDPLHLAVFPIVKSCCGCRYTLRLLDGTVIEERLEGNELEFKVDEGEPFTVVAECIIKQLACLQHEPASDTTELTVRRTKGEAYHLTNQSYQQLQAFFWQQSLGH